LIAKNGISTRHWSRTSIRTSDTKKQGSCNNPA
jgi:hypothetical protein